MNHIIQTYSYVNLLYAFELFTEIVREKSQDFEEAV